MGDPVTSEKVQPSRVSKKPDNPLEAWAKQVDVEKLAAAVVTEVDRRDLKTTSPDIAMQLHGILLVVFRVEAGKLYEALAQKEALANG